MFKQKLNIGKYRYFEKFLTKIEKFGDKSQ